MNLDFSEEQEMLRTSARDFLTKECPQTLARNLDKGWPIVVRALEQAAVAKGS